MVSFNWQLNPFNIVTFLFLFMEIIWINLKDLFNAFSFSTLKKKVYIFKAYSNYNILILYGYESVKIFWQFLKFKTSTANWNFKVWPMKF